MDVQLLYFEGCPSWQQAAAHLQTIADEVDGISVTRIVVDTPELAERYRFRGSPTITAGGSDLFADDDAPVGLSCRLYQTPDGPAGSPTLDQVRAALELRSAHRPN